MTIPITVLSKNRRLEFGILTKNVDTHSWLSDRPKLSQALQDAVTGVLLEAVTTERRQEDIDGSDSST
jgi:hypothetical protein